MPQSRAAMAVRRLVVGLEGLPVLASSAKRIAAMRPGTRVRVADDGELLVKGGQVFAGYWNILVVGVQGVFSTQLTYLTDKVGVYVDEFAAGGSASSNPTSP